MNNRIKNKRRKLNRAAPSLIPVQIGNGTMYVSPGQQQGLLGQTFYGSQAGIPTGQTTAFSPGIPLYPQPSVDLKGQPFQFRFPIAQNTFPVDRTLGDHDIPSFEQLRMLAKLYNGITLCERAWFDMVPKMKLAITLKPEYIVAGAEPRDYQTEITYFLNWFESPDKMRDQHSWLRMALREQTQIDELYIYKRRKRNGALHALEIIDGAQMKPLLDDWGRIPAPPAKAYQQYPWGLPGVWLSSDEVIHYQETPRVESPYGQSRVERIIMLVNQALRKQKKDLAHFTDGNIPQGMMLVPESAIWTPDQIDAFEQAWNSLLSGNAAQQVRMRFTQPGMKYQAFEQYALDPTFDKFLINICVSSYGLSMQDVAFTEDIHKSSGDFQENVTYRRTVDPLATIYAKILTEVVNNDFPPELKGEMFQVTFGGYEEEEDVSEMSGAYSELVKAGILGVTAAGKLMKLPDDPNAPYIGRVIVTKDGPVFLDDMATDKMRAAQVQAQLAGLQAATVNPGKNPQQQQPQNPTATAQTTSTATSGTASGQQTTVKKSDNLQTANSAPQLNPKYQANKQAATEDIGGIQPHIRAQKQQEEKPSKEDALIDDKYHDFTNHNENNDLSDFDPSLLGDEPIDLGPDIETEEDMDNVEGDEDFDPSIDEDKLDWSPEDYEAEKEVQLLLDSDKDEPFSELERALTSELERHHPGGKDHDQKTHGDWAHPGYASGHAKTGLGASSSSSKSGSGASSTGPSSGTYGPINAKIIKASSAVQTAAKDLLAARQNLENASAADKANARQAVATARQELHDARLALELYRQQARQMRIQAQKQARAEAAKQRAEQKAQNAKAKAERQKAKAKLAAQKQKAHLAKVAAAAKTKAARLAAKAQLKAQIAAAKAAKATAKASSKAKFTTAAKNNASAKTVQNLTNTIASKAVLYNTLASRPISKNWTQEDAANAHQISLDLKQLADMVNNHADETQMNTLLNQMNTSMSELAGSSRFSHKISANAGRPGAASSARITHPISSGRTGVFEKLLSKAQAEAALNRALESVEFYEEETDDEEYSYTISEIVQLFSEQMQDEEAEEADGEDFERSEKSTMVEGATGEPQSIENLRQQGFTSVTWVSSCDCSDCQRNNGITRTLGMPFPSGHILPPCHDGCPCYGDYHTEADTKKIRSAEYRNWRQRAIDDVKEGRAIREFVATFIPEKLFHFIQTELQTCTTVDTVKAVFTRAKELEQHQITVFVDIDGVLSITNAGNRMEMIDQKEAWPIPQADYFIQQLSNDPQLNPVWLTHWGQKANHWNKLTGVESWPVAFPLSEQEETAAKMLFPSYARKQLAIAYYMHLHQTENAVWIQDGFAPETKVWAQLNHVRLIDTNSEPYHSQLLNETEQSIQQFLTETIKEPVLV